MERTVCRGCESPSLQMFLDLGDVPLAGGFLPDAEAIKGEKLYPLKVHICEGCSLVQILQVVDANVLFQDYSFASSTVGPLVQHFENYAEWVKRRFEPKVVVEFGSNDGILLAPLEKLGITACGVDISVNIGEIARAKGFDVVTGYFDENTVEKIEQRLGKADVVTGSNSFAHNDKPEVILKAARRVLKENGHLCLEVMYAGDLLELFQWDTLYHEHLTFYSLSALRSLLERYDFRIVDAERIPMHGGSLRVVASKNRHERVQPQVEEILRLEEQRALNEPSTWLAFGQETKRKIEVVRQTLGRISLKSRIWGYGAAGKATMWVNACEMGYLEAMVDASPLRAGKLMPGTHTPIVFPDKLKNRPPDYIFLTAWNYADVIRAKESWFDGIWAVPLPELRFL